MKVGVRNGWFGGRKRDQRVQRRRKGTVGWGWWRGSSLAWSKIVDGSSGLGFKTKRSWDFVWCLFVCFGWLIPSNYFQSRWVWNQIAKSSPFNPSKDGYQPLGCLHPDMGDSNLDRGKPNASFKITYVQMFINPTVKSFNPFVTDFMDF